MNTLGEESKGNCQPAMDEVSLETFDPRAHFAEWLRAVEDIRHARLGSPAAEVCAPLSDSMSLECFAESDCEITFAGELYFEGDLTGSIHSFEGTLVMKDQSTISADISVGTALIDGTVRGNITASERVVLESNARVEGQIRTSSLSVHQGAIFEGNSIFFETNPESDANEWFEDDPEALLEPSLIGV